MPPSTRPFCSSMKTRSAAAKEYIAAAQTGPIFPEEKKLLEEAIAKASAAAPSQSTP